MEIVDQIEQLAMLVVHGGDAEGVVGLPGEERPARIPAAGFGRARRLGHCRRTRGGSPADEPPPA